VLLFGEKNHFCHFSKKELLSDRLSQQIVNAKSEDFYRHYGVHIFIEVFFLVNDPMALIGLLAASRFVFVFVSPFKKNVVHYYYYYSLAESQDNQTSKWMRSRTEIRDLQWTKLEVEKMPQNI
jgi:hypothetical protein